MRIISGIYRSRRIARPNEKTTRPTSDRTREALFNILSNLSDFSFQGATVLDAFAGSGALGLEALSRGAAHVVFMERDTQVLSVIKYNIAVLQINPTQVTLLKGDATQPTYRDQPVDLIFLDPPYHQGLEVKCIDALCEKGWISSQTILVIETAANMKLETPKNWITLVERTYGAAKITIGRIEGM